MRFRELWGNRGQAAVETALVMPLNLFLLLGIIQYALISQARVLTKYAAYRAVRVGVMNHASKVQMSNAAMLTLLPVITQSKKLDGIGGSYHFPNIEGGKALPSTKAYTKDAAISEAFKLVLGTGLVSVEICGPIDSELKGKRDQQTLHSIGSSQEVDFDDPQANEENPGEDPSQAGGYQNFMATKLRIQVQFLYIMPIPFANWAISNAYLAEFTSKAALDIADEIHHAKETDQLLITSQTKDVPPNPSDTMALKLWALNTIEKVYVAPIVANYAMRMQSNFYLGDYQLPASDVCRHLAGE